MRCEQVRSMKAQDRRGVASLEFAVVAPFLIGILFGVWEVGRLVHAHQVVSNATREAGRQAATGKWTSAEVEEVVLDYLTNAGLKTTNAANVKNVTILVKNLTSNGEVKDATQGDEIEVSVSYPYKNARWFFSGTFVSDTATLDAKSYWRSLTDIPVTIPTTIPSKPASIP